MIINRSHIPWFLGTVVVTAVAGLLYLANFHHAKVPFMHLPGIFGPVPPVRQTVGGTPLGLLFGAISYLIFLIAAGLGIRKKRRTWPIGNVKLWMKLHIWLTILSIPLILFHCGFRFGGPMTTLLMLLYIIVMVSGFYGLALQQIMPSMMTRRLPQEAVFEAIPRIKSQLVESAERLWRELAPSARRMSDEEEVQQATESHLQLGGHSVTALVAPATETEAEAHSRKVISEFLHDECFPYLRAEDGRKHRLANVRLADDAFRSLRLNCTPKWQPQVQLMEQWCFDRRAIDAQIRMHHWLHGWLFLHVPLSFILLVFTLWHAFVTIIYL